MRFVKLCQIGSSANGNRTRITALRGQRPKPLDDSASITTYLVLKEYDAFLNGIYQFTNPLCQIQIFIIKPLSQST